MINNKDDTMGGIELPEYPEIVTRSKVISSQKEDGSTVEFYIFPEFEIHTNTMPPKTIQDWHYHKEVEEIIFVINGELSLFWLDDNNQKTEKILKPYDLCRLGKSKHTIANNSGKEVKFLIHKLVTTGKNKHSLIETDRYEIENI